MYAPHRLFVVGVVLGFVICFIPVSVAQTLPTLPQAFVDTSYPVSTGLTTTVNAGGDLQGALNAAQLGDTIQLAAGATFVGNYTLPAKVGSGWIIVRTSAPDSSLPPAGTRITPAYAGVLPKIVSPNTAAAIQTAPGAHHYRFVGVEFTLAAGVALNYGIVLLGDGSSLQNSLSQVPYSLVLDRVYVHGLSTGDVSRGVALNCASAAVIDSYISDAHFAGADAQAILGWNGPGPFKITNNYLEGAGENMMFGGADPWIANLVPSDIEVRGNYFNKPLAWQGSTWTIKNLFELKNARRVLVDGNVFEHNWPQAQNGFSVLFTVRNQTGTAPWSVVEDITFTHNILRHVAAGVNMLGWDNLASSQQTKRILVKDNLFDDINSVAWGGNGTVFQILSGTADVTINHNTTLQTGEALFGDGIPNVRFAYQNNLAPNNTYGVGGTGTFGNPMLTLTTFFPGAVFVKNVLAGGNPASYPPNNFFPATLNDVLFVSLTGGNYRLQAASPYKNAGTDGMDVGADINAVDAATVNAITGNGPAPPPPPPGDTTPPSVSLTAPANGATVSATTTISANASDNVGVVGVQFFVDGATVGAEVMVAPYQVSWNTTAATNGSHSVTAIARDAAGNRTTSGPVSVTVANTIPDTTPPSVSLTAPASGATVSATTTISANASDNVGVVGVQFFVDGATVGAEVMVAPYQVTWNTTAATNGSHSVTAIARDAAGNRTTSAAVTVTVSNFAPPVPRSPYTGTPFPIPGRFEAEDFDKGGEGVAYHDMTPGNQGGLYRTMEDVDIVSGNGGYVVNNFQTGEWMEYSINVAQTGNYKIEALLSSEYTTSRFHIEVDRIDKTGPINVPSTGNWTIFQWLGKDAVSLTAGQHILRITAEVEYFNIDALRITTSAPPPDVTPPTVAISGPLNGATVFRLVGISATASDNVGVAGVQFFVDGVAIDTEKTAAPYQTSWDSTLTTNGSHVLSATARDAAGNTASASVTVTVSNVIPDTTPPSVSLTAPASGATVSATTTISANASDNVGVVGVQFFVDGATVGAEVMVAPYQVTWNTTGATNGSHSVTAIARDAAGNRTTSAAVTVTVSNFAPPVPRSPYTGTPFPIPGRFEAEDFDKGGEGVAYHDMTPGNQGGLYRTMEDVDIVSGNGGYVVNNFQTGEWMEYSINVAQTGNYKIEVLLSSEYTTSRFHIEVDRIDKTGPINVPSTGNWTIFQWLGKDAVSLTAGQHILRITADVEYFNIDALRITTSAPPADTTPPSVSITAPANGATATEVMTISANASDDVGVVGVQFMIDGAAWGAEVISAPYQTSWDTASATNGGHTLTAVARDAAGNRTTSAVVSVMVSNTTPDTTLPSVAITAPASGAILSGVAIISANASDNVGVVGVQFMVDGAAWGAEVMSAPYQTSWNTASSANGPHTLTAVARDAAGNRTTSAPVSVTVANVIADTTPPSVAITAPASGATIVGVTTISANASDNVGVVGVQFIVDGAAWGAEVMSAPYQTSWNTALATNGPHTLTAVARDAAGNRTTSAPVSATVANTIPDTTLPSVAITAPASGATLSGVAIISANASDNVGVVGVQFIVDGAAWGAEVMSGPYQTSWNTALATNGLHTLTAVARDAAGNRTTSAPITVGLVNVVPPAPGSPESRTPFHGSASQVPGQIEAEDFDKGGEGVAYHDLTPGNQGGAYRTSEDVDIISPYPLGFVVENFDAGEWLIYTINVVQSGTYRVQAQVSSESASSRFHMEVDGVDKTGGISVPNTGWNGLFRSVEKGGIYLTAGQHTLRVDADAGSFNVDWWSFALESAARDRVVHH